jgi:hypothetical protein
VECDRSTIASGTVVADANAGDGKPMGKICQRIVAAPRRHKWTRGKASNRAASTAELLRFYNRLEGCLSESVSGWLMSAVGLPAAGDVRRASLNFPFRTSQLAVFSLPNRRRTVPDEEINGMTFCRKRISP